MKTRSTLKDVASAAGVSPTTVSLYLNGSHQVCSDETATRIREAVTELQYTRGLKALREIDPSTLQPPSPHHDSSADGQASSSLTASVGTEAVSDALGRLHPGAGARSALMTARRLRTIGIALPSTSAVGSTELSHPAMEQFTDQLWIGATEVAEWEEFRLLSFPRRLRTTAAVDAFTDGSIGGLILEAGFQDPRLSELVRFGLPIVVVNRFLDIPDGCGAVYPMVRDTVDVPLNYLWEKGHRRIAHYGGPGFRVEEEIPPISDAADTAAIRWTPSDFAILRAERFQAFMRQHQAIDRQLDSCEDTWDGDHADAHLEKWLSLPDPPTAVFCDSDSLALALWSAAERRGVSIPEDLSIVGIGDSPANYRHNRPLTTVALPGAEVGREAVRLLLRMMEGIPADRCRLAIPLDRSFLVERASVRPCVIEQARVPQNVD